MKVSDAAVQDESTPRSVNVLLVEDNLDALEWLVEIVGYLGHNARGCDNAESALEVLQKQSFNVLITDISLAGMNGLDLAKKARELQPELAITFASGSPRGPNIPSDIQWLQKPFTIEDLTDAIASVNIRS
jgi:CheY-like chemotaxis protein